MNKIATGIKTSKKKEEQPVAKAPQSPANPNRVTMWHLGILALAYVIIYFNIYDPKINLNGDNIYYYMLGKSIATGQGYTNIFSPSLEPHNHFSPGYPFILSLFMRLGIYSMDFINVLNGVMTLVSIIIFYRLVLNVTANRRLAFAASTLVMVNVMILNYASIAMSEASYMLFSLLAIYCLTLCDLDKPVYKNLTFVAVLASVVMAYYTRSTGTLLCLSIIIYFITKKKWIYAATTAGVFFLSVLPWYLRTQKLGGDVYVKQLMMKNPYETALGQANLGDFAARLVLNLQRYISIVIPNSLFPGVYDTLNDTNPPLMFWVSGILFVLLIGYAMIKLIRRYPSMVLYLAMSMGTLMLWPTQWKDLRFTVPFIPFLMLFLVIGANDLISKFLERRNVTWNPYFFCVILLFTSQYVLNMTKHKDESYQDAYRSYFEMAEWAKDHLPPNAVVCTRKPEFFYFFSEHPCVSYTFTKDDKELLNDLTKAKVDYVVLDPLPFQSTRMYLLPALEKNRERFDLTYQVKAPDVFLLKYKR